MSKYLVRLDDACERRNIVAWDRIERLLDQFGVKPLVGIIPCCQDPAMSGYPEDGTFWARVDRWVEKGWTLALHGCDHVYRTEDGGLNPVNRRSEFAGESLDVQREKIRRGLNVMIAHGHRPQIFFAPAHTFDYNTLEALRLESDIRIICDTIASDLYWKDGFCYIPQQSGHFCKLPVKVMTACFHPNVMPELGFQKLKAFLRENQSRFICCPDLLKSRPERTACFYDDVLNKMYFFIKRVKKTLT